MDDFPEHTWHTHRPEPYRRVAGIGGLKILADPTLPGNYLRIGNHHHDLTDPGRHFVTREDLTVFDEQPTDRPLPCGATRRPVQDAGWECTGRDLVSVTTTRLQGQTLPVVLPARALDALPAGPWWDVQPFTGGDHLHLVPPTWPGRRQQ